MPSSGATGVPASRKYPSVYTQVAFGASPNTAGGAPRRVLMLANKTSAGSATVDSVIYGPLTPDTAKDYFGVGSEGHLGAIAAAALEPGAELYGIAVTESAGVKASQSLTVAGVAGGDGNLAVRIHGVVVNVSIISGLSAVNAAIAIKNAINGTITPLNVTATDNGAGVVTVTARHNGTRGNDIAITVTKDASITTQTYTLGGGKLTGGTLTDTIATALTTASVKKFDYVALAQVDTANLQLFQTKALANAGPLVRKRMVGISWNADVQATATTQATTLNEPLLQILWQKKGECIPIQATAGWAARRSVRESDEPNYHFSLFNPDAVDLHAIVPSPELTSDWMLESEAATALDVGLTPVITRSTDGHPMVALSITSHSQDSLGNPDARTLTTNYVIVPFHWADEVEAFIPTNFPGMYLRDDPVEGDEPLPPNTITPLAIGGFLKDLYKRKYDLTGQIKNFDADTATWQINIDANNPNRVDSTMEVTPAPWFTQFSSRILQLTP